MIAGPHQTDRTLIERYAHHMTTNDPKGAAELLKVGLAPAPANTDPAELAAWTSVARVVLNLHEAVTRN